MNCPKCGGPLQPGRAVVEWPRGQSGVGLWLFALRTVLVGSGPMNWYFEPTGGEGVVLMVFKRAEKK